MKKIFAWFFLLFKRIKYESLIVTDGALQESAKTFMKNYFEKMSYSGHENFLLIRHRKSKQILACLLITPAALVKGHIGYRGFRLHALPDHILANALIISKLCISPKFRKKNLQVLLFRLAFVFGEKVNTKFAIGASRLYTFHLSAKIGVLPFFVTITKRHIRVAYLFPPNYSFLKKQKSLLLPYLPTNKLIVTNNDRDWLYVLDKFKNNLIRFATKQEMSLFRFDHLQPLSNKSYVITLFEINKKLLYALVKQDYSVIFLLNGAIEYNIEGSISKLNNGDSISNAVIARQPDEVFLQTSCIKLLVVLKQCHVNQGAITTTGQRLP